MINLGELPANKQYIIHLLENPRIHKGDADRALTSELDGIALLDDKEGR